MSLKQHIVEFIDCNNHIMESAYKILKTFEDTNDSGRITLELASLLKSTRYNPALGVDFLIHLQLIEEKDLFSQFGLDDLRNLINSLVEVEKFKSDIFIEAASFEWNVMDDKERAQDHIKSGIEDARKRIQELELIQIEIDSEV